MNELTRNQSVESVYTEFYKPLVGYVHGRFSKISKFAEEVATDAFVDFVKYRAKNGNKDVWNALKRCACHRAISLIRREEAIKRGGRNLVSLEALMDAGFEPDAVLAGSERVFSLEPEQVEQLQYTDQLVLVDRVLEVAIPKLLEKELILVRHIRRWAPVELTLSELVEELSPLERLRFLPVHRRSLHMDPSDFVLREVGRSRGRLQRQLREIRSEMGI